MSDASKPNSTEPTELELEKQAEPDFQHYSQCAGLWRSWVIGTAAGAIFILLNKDMSSQFSSRAQIALIWITAAGIQVLLAFFNKQCAYARYAEKVKQSAWYLKRFDKLNDHYWVDLGCDILSLALLAWAVVWMVYEVLSQQTIKSNCA